MELDLTEYSKFLIAMLAIVDPLAILPLYARMTATLPEGEKPRLARRVGLSTFVALLIALFLGRYILEFFGISLASFRIAGGLLLMVMAFQLLYAPGTTAPDSGVEDPIESQVVVPLAIPLLAGPGAFSAVIVFGARNPAWWHSLLISACLAIICLIIWLSLHMSSRILRRVGATSIAITNKVMGLIMAAIAIEFIANGIRQMAQAS